MKTIIITIGAIALAATLFATPLQSQGGGSANGSNSTMHLGKNQNKPVPAIDVKGVQTRQILIHNGKYSPAMISVKKGKPVALTFKLGKNPGCGSTVVFKSLKISRVVPKGKSIVIKFTPKKAGKIAFTCDMGMYNGTVVVK